MAKLWSKPRRIEVYSKVTREKITSFIADDATSISPINTFYLESKEVYWYDERKCYYKSFKLESED